MGNGGWPHPGEGARALGKGWFNRLNRVRAPFVEVLHARPVDLGRTRARRAVSCAQGGAAHRAGAERALLGETDLRQEPHGAANAEVRVHLMDTGWWGSSSSRRGDAARVRYGGGARAQGCVCCRATSPKRSRSMAPGSVCAMSRSRPRELLSKDACEWGTLELLTRGAFGKARLSRSQADSAAFSQTQTPTTKRGNSCTTARGFERRCWIATLVRTSP